MDKARIRQRLAGLRRERETLERKLLGCRGKLVEGSLCERYTECRKGNCKCTRGKPHGPFLYLSLLKKGKSIYRYVGKEGDRPIVEGLRRYKVFQSSLEKTRKVNKEINDLWNQLRRELLKNER